ncbi:hypothetical protein [Aeromonas phage 1233]|nr:hypothetical protein [Aeromonas phage 1233]
MAIIKGKVLFASTTKPDIKFGAPGNYYVTIQVDEATYADAEQLGLKCKRNVYKGQEQLTVNLRLKGGGTRKDGSQYVNDPIPVVIRTPENDKAPYVEKARDENGDVVTRAKEIPQGSKVKVSYKTREWTMMGKTGTAFDLRAVQIIEEGSSNDPMGEFDGDEDDDEEF